MNNSPANKQLKQLLIFLIAFLICAVAVAAAAHFKIIGGGEAFTFLDSKGILTGPGTFLAVLIGSLAALILFVWIKLSFAHKEHAQRSAPRPVVAVPPAKKRARDEWLISDVLGRHKPPSPNWTDSMGHFREREMRIERLSDGFIRATVLAECPFDLRVWQKIGHSANPPASGAPAPSFATQDEIFEARCDWQSGTPDKAFAFLARPGVTALLYRLTFFGIDPTHDVQEGIVIGGGVASLKMRMPDTFINFGAGKILVNLCGLCLLVDALTGKALEKPQPPLRSQTFVSHTFSCLLISLFILAPIGILWTGGSYLAAKYFGLWAGMGFFFGPLMLLALFVFTRPEGGNTSATDGDFFIREEEINSQYRALLEEMKSDAYITELLTKYDLRLPHK